MTDSRREPPPDLQDDPRVPPADDGRPAGSAPGTSRMTSGTAPANSLVSESYGVRLEVFEGPLDLLLYLIRRNEVDIYDIPVSTITNQYLAYLSQVHLSDLEQASEFILMAATLMKIKSQMLLPREVMPEVDETEGDPRAELVRLLLEYQQFKEIAEWLDVRRQEQRDVYPLGQRSDGGGDGEIVLHRVSLFDLLAVYKHVLEHVPPDFVHRIVEEETTVEECIARLLVELERHSRLRFFELVSGQSRQAMVTTFIGVLELLKAQRIKVQQARPFDEIWIEGQPQADPATAPDTQPPSVSPAPDAHDPTLLPGGQGTPGREDSGE